MTATVRRLRCEKPDAKRSSRHLARELLRRFVCPTCGGELTEDRGQIVCIDCPVPIVVNVHRPE